MTSSKPITRQRYIELCAIASEVVDFMVEKGVSNQSSEGCIVREMAERLWNLSD